jgi:hypothetical protein
MTEKYGTNISGLTAFEGDVSTDSGASLIDTDSDGESALLFGPAAVREILAGIANGDFALPPDDADSDLSDENPLPYWTFTDNSSGGITAAVISEPSNGSGNVLKVTLNTTNGNNVQLTRYVPIPGSRNREFVFNPEFTAGKFSAGPTTPTTDAYVKISFQYYTEDQVTTTGTGDSATATFTDIGSVKTVAIGTANATRLAAPPDAGWMLVTLEIGATGTVAAKSIEIAELRLVTGSSDLYIAENTAPGSYGPARLRQTNGVLSITPDLGGSGSISFGGAVNFSSLTVSGTAGTASVTLNNGNFLAENGLFRGERTAAGSAVFTGALDTDTGDRVRIEAGGTIEWGDGTSGTGDVNLYRSSSTTLQTDDAFAADSITSTLGVYSGNGNFRADGPGTATTLSNQCVFALISGTEYIIRRYTSSARYKTDIFPADEVVLEASRKIVPKHFTSTVDNPQELGQTRLGFIAEEIHEAGLTHAVAYNADGQPESIDSVALIAALWHRVNDLESRLKALETE